MIFFWYLVTEISSLNTIFPFVEFCAHDNNLNVFTKCSIQLNVDCRKGNLLNFSFILPGQKASQLLENGSELYSQLISPNTFNKANSSAIKH